MKIKQQSKRSSAVGIAASLLTVGLWLATSSLPAFAADFSVNETFDAMDKTPGDGVCEVTNNGGDCTLRAAVMEANALPGADSITVPAGTYELTLTGVLST